jgi:hypothetical protein
VRNADEPADGSNDPDAAAAAAAHDRQHSKREVDRPPLHDVDGFLEVLASEGRQRPNLNHAGDVDRHLDRSDLVLDPAHQALHELGVTDVADHGSRDDPLVGQDGYGAVQLALVAGPEHRP